jgi:hypothetical protein
MGRPTVAVVTESVGVAVAVEYVEIFSKLKFFDFNYK